MIMNEMETTEAESMNDFADLMTPEELAQLKELQAKRKEMQKAMSGVKESFFKTLTETYGSVLAKVKKDVVTISTKEAHSDGNIWAITFGVEEDTKEGDIDTKELTTTIIDAHLANIERLMGISNSLKVQGEVEGKKVYFQFRKRT